MRQTINNLLKSNLTSYKIAKDTKIPVQQIDRYRKKENWDNMTFKTAEKLYNYYKEIDK